MKNYRIFLLSLFLLTILTVGFASATEDNLTVSDNQTLQSVDEDIISIDSDSQEDGELFTDEDNGTYLDPTEAYECLNEFRTSEGVWYWDSDNENVHYFNTNDNNRLKPLVVDERLEETAKIRAKEISILFEHQRPDGTDCFTAYPTLDGNGLAGENIAWSYLTGKDVTEAWKESVCWADGQGHRRNMLSSGYNCVGIGGYLDSNGVPHWVQAFGNKYIPETPIVKNETQRNESKATFTDLNNLIAGNNLITLDRDYEFYNESAFDKGIVINKSVTIDGCGHSIDGNRLARIFNITSPDVILKNIMFLNTYIDYENGGAVYTNVDVTLINCTFKNNFAYHGSAVYATNGVLSLINCYFNDNYAVEGAVYADGGVISIEDCSFDNNSAMVYGAAMGLHDAEAILADSIFTNNFAYLKGGAINLVKANITSKNCSFSNNALNSDAYAFGAVMYGDESSVTCRECSFKDNKINSDFRAANGGVLFLIDGQTSFIDCNFTNNYAMSRGGAVCLVNNNASISNSRFVNNSGNSRGSVSYGGAIFSDRGNLIIEKTDFNNNTADFGGAVYLKTCEIEVSNDTFTNNNGTMHGGAIFAADANVTVADSIFSDNYALVGGGALSVTDGNASVENTDFINGTTHFGGAINLENTDGHVKNCNFINNTVDSESAADGSALHLRNGNMSVESCHFENNTSHSKDYFTRGGAIFCEDGNASFKDCEFERFVLDRGIIFLNRASVSVEECSFKDSVLNFYGAFDLTNSYANISKCSFSNISSHEGGAVYVTYGNVSISDSTFSNMISRFDGASIYSWCGNITVNNCDFTDNIKGNDSAKNGGAVYVNNAYVSIVASNFTNCIADSFGGALYLSNCHGAIEQSRFVNNSISSINYQLIGGAIYSINGNMSISDCAFENNSLNATYYTQGGAIALRGGNYSISNCIFNNNSVNSSYQYGGAICCENAIVSINASKFYKNAANYGGALSGEKCEVVISDSDFTCNSADSEGGSIALDTCNVTISSCNFENGHANYGGAIEAYLGNLTVKKSSFTNNSSIHGGAIYSWGNATAIASNFTNNTANWDGGAIYHGNAIDSTFTGNVANSAGAIYGDNNYATNCKFIRNVAYEDNPTHNTTIKDCTYVDNMQITRVVIDASYPEDEYYIGDNLYIRVYTPYYPFETITNATITMKLYKGNELQNTFKFSSGDMGWTVNVSEGTYFAELSIEDIEFEADPINITFNVAHKEIANVDVRVNSPVYSNPATVNILSSVGGDVEVYIDDFYVDYQSVAANANKQMSYYGMNSGSHVLRIVMTPTNSKIDPVTITKDFTIQKKETTVDLDVENTVSGENVVVYVKASENGNVLIKIGDGSQDAYVNANERTQIFMGAMNSGTYVVSAKFSAGDNYIDSETSKTLKIFDKITQDDIKIAKGESENLIINLPADATGTVTLSINGENYNVDIIGGVAEVNLSDLAKCEYSYIITYSGDDKYSGFDMGGDINTASSSESPTIKPDIVVPPIDDCGQVQLPADATGTVTLTINGNGYIFDVIDGTANVELPKLANGAYSYTITYSGDGKYSSFAQTSYLEVNRPVVISVSNLKATYSAGAYCQITVKNDLGIAADGVVVITQNGKKFKTLTTKNGVCKFKITQKPGSYKLIITAQSKSVSKTLIVKHLLSLKKVTPKKSAKKLVLTATLAKVNKKYLKNKKITFKFNGKKYTAKTNKKGVAKVSIKKAVLKKLKVGKKITYQATYLKDTVKYSVKVKK